MKLFTSAVLLSITLAASSAAAANLWGINGEEKARIQVKVVDILCELTGDCPPNCGDGRRQFGLLQDDGTLLLAIKNNDPFAGTASDLAPFCGQRIEADGLMIKNERMNMFVLQFKRTLPDGEWSRANWFTKDWSERNGMPADRWFDDDPTIQAELKANGILGLPGVEYVEEE